MFLREDKGVYQFGAKRVLVRLMRDSIQVKGDGGYLAIDNFLDVFLPEELYKLEQKDPLKKVIDQAERFNEAGFSSVRSLGNHLSPRKSPRKKTAKKNPKMLKKSQTEVQLNERGSCDLESMQIQAVLPRTISRKF